MNRSVLAATKFAANENFVRILFIALLALFLFPFSVFAQCTSTWNGGTGSWDVAGNWTPSDIPTSASNTCINAANSSVTINGSDSTDNLTLGLSTDSLTIGNNENLTIAAGGNISNAGNITIGSTANNTILVLNGATTLSGTGTLTMSNVNGANYIEGNSGTLTNEQTIQGSGIIGNGSLTLVNTGASALINANNAANQLLINAQSGTTNTNGGIMEASAGGLLNIDGSTVANTGGTLLATGTNSVVLLNGTSVTGGTLTSTLGGIIQASGATVTSVTISAGSTLEVNNNQSLTLGAGTITNNGTILLDSVANNTVLAVNGATTLAGTGTVTMSDINNANYIQGGGTLTNQETIQGSGTIGNSALTLVNSGTIDADNSNFELLINPSGGTTNNGTLEATNGGTLEIRTDPVTNNATILATGAGSVVLLNGTTVTGGTLTSTAGGVFQAQNTTLNTLTISTGTNFDINNNQTVTLGAGTITNNGTILLDSTANNTILTVNGATTLAGTGTVTLTDESANYIEGSGTLTNQQTIQGSGTIGNGGLTLINSGTIDADNPSNELLIDPQGGTTNTKTMEATAGGTLEIRSYPVNNAGGTILATGAGSTVLLNAATITGGTLTSSAGGVFQAENNPILNPLTLSTGTNLDILNNQSLTLGAGTITNNGTILLDSTANNTILTVNGATTLAGTGTVTLTDESANYIEGSGTLTNQQTIQGSGTIGNGGLTLINSGTIDADNPSNELLIDPQGGTTNTKTMEATAGGTLEIRSYPVNNAGGTILATGAGSTVLLNAATITGGTLTSSSGGLFNAEAGATLDALTISTGTTIDVLNNQSMDLVGTITNKGTINVGSTVGNNTFLDINGNVTLTAPGKVILSASSANYISGSGMLTNQGTIEGEGNIGNGALQVINSGSILANETKAGTTPSTLYIDTGSAGFSNNVGTKNGILNVSAKNTIDIEGGPFTNYSDGTLTGGTYIVAGTLEFSASGDGIVTNEAAITLSNATAEIKDTSNSSNMLTVFADNGTKGSFTVNGFTFTDNNLFTNSGILAVGAGGKFDAAAGLTNFSGTTLTGGTYNLTGTGQLQFLNANIVTNDAKITLAGVDTTKSSIIDQMGNNALANYNANGSSGALYLTTNRQFTTGGSLSNAGIVDVEKSTGTGTTQLSVNGTYTQTGGTATVDGLLSTVTGINVSGGFIYGNAAGTTTGKLGTLVGNFDLTGGTINPGDGIKKIGDLNITGTYNESGAGILNIDLDGTIANTKYDVLNISGAATLGGTLDMNQITGFTPTSGETFDILNAGSVSGAFTTVDCAFSNGDSCTVTYNPTDVIVTITGGAVASQGAVSATPAHRISRTFGDTSAATTHEPTAILASVTCFAARMIGSACGDKASAATVSHGGEVASAHTMLNSAHNNVMVATHSISSGRGGASHETSASASAMARLYVCAYVPSTVGHTMGCN